MERTAPVVTPVPQARKTEREFTDPDRLFYVVAAGMMLILTAGGFRRLYLHGKAPWGEIAARTRSRTLAIVVVREFMQNP